MFTRSNGAIVSNCMIIRINLPKLLKMDVCWPFNRRSVQINVLTWNLSVCLLVKDCVFTKLIKEEKLLCQTFAECLLWALTATSNLYLFTLIIVAQKLICNFSVLSFSKFILEKILNLICSYFFKTESNLTKEMELVIKDIKNTTQKKYMDYGKNPGSPDNDFLFMYSVAR